MSSEITKALKIGTVTLDSPVVLAPMAGVTDMAMRIIARRFGAGATFSEITNALGVAKNRPEAMFLLASSPHERPLACHLSSPEPETLGAAVAVAAQTGRFDFIDINCGCPVRRVVARGAGAALMRDPSKIAAMVKNAREASNLPVTIKTRTGVSKERINILETARAVEEAGASAIFLHARVAANKHAGVADWDMIARVSAECKIPVIGNGGITTGAEAVNMLKATGVAGVMIGRAAVGNPWIFQEAKCLLEGREWKPPAPEERIGIMLEHFNRMIELKQLEKEHRRVNNRFTLEQAAAMRFRHHLFHYLPGPGKRELCKHYDPESWIALYRASL